MSFIIDSSVALSWFLPDEQTDEALALYDLARRTQLIVPPLWHLEIANVLGVNAKRKRIHPDDVDLALQALSMLAIRTVPLLQANDAEWYTVQMRTHGLTAYDTVYLMLAQELGMPLATFDREIIAAASKAGIVIVRAGE